MYSKSLEYTETIEDIDLTCTQCGSHKFKLNFYCINEASWFSEHSHNDPIVFAHCLGCKQTSLENYDSVGALGDIATWSSV